jgi:hypothetical protein
VLLRNSSWLHQCGDAIAASLIRISTTGMCLLATLDEWPVYWRLYATISQLRIRWETSCEARIGHKVCTNAMTEGRISATLNRPAQGHLFAHCSSFRITGRILPSCGGSYILYGGNRVRIKIKNVVLLVQTHQFGSERWCCSMWAHNHKGRVCGYLSCFEATPTMSSAYVGSPAIRNLRC